MASRMPRGGRTVLGGALEEISSRMSVPFGVPLGFGVVMLRGWWPVWPGGRWGGRSVRVRGMVWVWSE